MKITNFHEDMTVFRDKTAGARSVFLPYGSVESALLSDESDRVYSLNGEWRFGVYSSILCVPDAVTNNAADVSAFNKVTLPNTVKTLGFDTFTGLDMPFDPPYITPDTPVAVFVKDIRFKPEDEPFRKYVVFEGISSAVYLFVNGNYVGFAEVSSAMQEFDITDFVNPDSNRICAVVMKYSDGSYLEKNDQNLFGIYSDSYILLRPKGHIRDFLVATSLSEDCTKGYISLTVDAVSYSLMSARLYSPFDEFLGEEAADGDGNFFFTVENPEFYSAENPLLYTVVLCFGGEYIPVKVGVRELKWDDNGLLYNKKRITLKAVKYGRRVKENGDIMTESDYINDLAVLKKHSVNTIVTDSAPLPTVFYRLCDRLGFYVIDTAELYCEEFEKHMPEIVSVSNEWESAVYNRINLLTARDKNFSSVIAYNLHPSVKTGKNVFFTVERVRRLDKMRTVHYGNEGRGGFPKGLVDFDALYEFKGKFDSQEISQRIKRLYKPITVTPLELASGRFEIQNNFDFSYISSIEIFCEISAFGKPIKIESMGIMTLASKKSAEFCVEMPEIPDGDATIRFYYKNIFETELLPDNHTIGFDSFEINRPYRRTEKAVPDTALKLEKTDSEFRVSGKDFSLVFNRYLGIVTDIKKRGEAIADKIQPSLYLFDEQPYVSHLEKLVIRDSDAEIDKDSRQVYITTHCIIGERGTVHRVLLDLEYVINRAGEITIKYRYERENSLCGVSRIGFDVYMPKEFNTVEYYSLGPVSFKGDDSDGYQGRFREQIKTHNRNLHHQKARFAAVYNTRRCGIIAYKKQSDFSFFVNTRSQSEMYLCKDVYHTVLSANAELQKEILTDQKIKGEISFRPINTDDGSLWGNATAVYK